MRQCSLTDILLNGREAAAHQGWTSELYTSSAQLYEMYSEVIRDLPSYLV